MKTPREGAGVGSTPDRRGAPWQSAGQGARSSGDSTIRESRTPRIPIPEHLTVIRPFIPISWFHPRGIKRVLARLTPRLPNVARCLFQTFTLNPQLFADPASAFEHARKKLRRIFYELRHGVVWEGKRYVIAAPYAVKVEFCGSEWVHFHVVFLTRRFVPAALVDQLWGLGRTNTKRISDEDFRYLLKYVTKGGDLPDWVKSRKRLRVFQGSRGFLLPVDKKPRKASAKASRPRASSSIGERLERQGRTALLKNGLHFEQIRLCASFDELHGRNILGAAKAGRYLGEAHYIINDAEDLLEWIK